MRKRKTLFLFVLALSIVAAPFSFPVLNAKADSKTVSASTTQTLTVNPNVMNYYDSTFASFGDWSLFNNSGNATAAATSTGGYYGLNYAQLTGSGLGDGGVQINAPVSTNTTYSISAWVRIPSDGGTTFDNGCLFVVNAANNTPVARFSPASAGKHALWELVKGSFSTGSNSRIWIRLDRGDLPELDVTGVKLELGSVATPNEYITSTGYYFFSDYGAGLFPTTYSYNDGTYSGTLTGSTIVCTPTFSTKTITGRKSAILTKTKAEILQRTNDPSKLPKSYTITTTDPLTGSSVTGSIPLQSYVYTGSKQDGVDRDWGYMWWMSDSSTTYPKGNWSDSSPAYPTEYYGHWANDFGSLSSSGWSATNIQWSKNVSWSSLGNGNNWYSDCSSIPPQRPGIEYYKSPQWGDAAGPWWDGDSWNNYREAVVVYYQRPWYEYDYNVTYAGTLSLPDITENTVSSWNVQIVYTGTVTQTASSNLSGSLYLSPTYYEDTDVTGAVNVNYSTNTTNNILPSTGVVIRIAAGGTNIYKTLLCPANKSSWVPFKFHTPHNPTASPSSMSVSVTIDSNNVLHESNESDNTLTQTVEIDSDRYTTPPATTYAPTAPDGWTKTDPPDNPSTNEVDWQEWRYVSGALTLKSFYVRAAASMSVWTDNRIRSSTYDSSTGVWTIRSGYGFGNTTAYNLSTNYDDATLITVPQRVRVYYPEFGYDMQSGVDQLTGTGKVGSSTAYSIQYMYNANPQSDFGSRIHFTPLWFPDGPYTVQENIRDVWTPDGQLNLWGTSRINISGSVYDDWSADLVPNP